MRRAIVEKQPTDSLSLSVYTAGSREIHKAATRISALFMFAVFADYGGGFGIKLSVGLLALIWVLLQASSSRILSRHKSDLLVFLGLPGVFGLLHWLLPLSRSYVLDPIEYGTQFYYTISSATLILLLPLFYYAGSQVVIRQIVIGFRIVTLLLLVTFVLHSAGVIDLRDYASLALDYRIGYIGLDPRLPGVQDRLAPNLVPAICFPMILALGHEVFAGSLWVLPMLLSQLVVGTLGQSLGTIGLVLSSIVLSLYRKRLTWLLTRIVPLGGLVIAIVLAVDLFSFRFENVLLSRMQEAIRGEDLSMLIRIGHVRGYLNLVEEESWIVLFGAGPGWSFINPVLGIRIALLEMSVLNLMLWYGIPYTLLYVLWLYRAAWRLWRLRKRPGFSNADLGLILGASVFWLVGNINPQMTSPFALIAYMLLTVRVSELTSMQHLPQVRSAS